MANREKLKRLLIDIFLIPEDEFRFDMRQDEVASWDSLGVIALEVGLKQTFAIPMTPQETFHLKSFQDVIHLLKSKGVDAST